MSIVEFYKENSEPYLCGYCKTNGAVSVGKFRAGNVLVLIKLL